MTEDLHHSLIDLQMRLAFQEDSLQQMSDQIAQQADEIRLAQRQIKALNQKLNDLQQTAETPMDTPNDRPPHY